MRCTVEIGKSILNANDAVARENRKRLAAASVLTINLMSAPGSGKTTLLRSTIEQLAPQDPSSVLVGDLETARDAERLEGVAHQSLQINTGAGCHLSAQQVETALGECELSGLSYMFIENIGNLVCPAAFYLGEHRRVVLLSVPEGDDKVAKYPTIFQPADLIILTKVDLLQYLDFDLERVKADLAIVNTRAPFLQLSTKSQEGMDEWLSWLREARSSLLA